MLVGAAALTPSAKNRQPWKYIVYTGRKTGCLRQWKKDLMRNSGITDCCQSQHSDFLTLFNTLRIMKEAPVVIIVMNTNGQSPYEDVDADGRVMEICDSLWIANTCFAYEKMNHVINAMGYAIWKSIMRGCFRRMLSGIPTM